MVHLPARASPALAGCGAAPQQASARQQVADMKTVAQKAIPAEPVVLKKAIALDSYIQPGLLILSMGSLMP